MERGPKEWVRELEGGWVIAQLVMATVLVVRWAMVED